MVRRPGRRPAHFRLTACHFVSPFEKRAHAVKLLDRVGNPGRVTTIPFAPSRVQRWSAPARRHRAGARSRPARHRLRRARLRAGRHRTGPGRRPAGRVATRTRARPRLRRPRPRRSTPGRRPGHGGAARTDRRGGTGWRGVRHPQDPYTKQLLAAAPALDPRIAARRRSVRRELATL